MLPFALDESPGGGTSGGLLAGAVSHSTPQHWLRLHLSAQAIVSSDTWLWLRSTRRPPTGCCHTWHGSQQAAVTMSLSAASVPLDAYQLLTLVSWLGCFQADTEEALGAFVRMLEQAPPLHAPPRGAAPCFGSSSERLAGSSGGGGGGHASASHHLTLAAGLQQLAALQGALQPAAVAT